MGTLKQGSHPHSRAIVRVRVETFKAESEIADLWQRKWTENQTVLVAAIHTLDRNAGSLEGAAAGSWSLGIVEQSQGEGCCWLWRDGLKGHEGGDCGGNACGGKPGSHGSKATLLSHAWGWSHHHSLSLPTGQHRQLSSREPGPSRAWLTDLQSRIPARGPFKWLMHNLQSRIPARGPFKCLMHNLQSRTPARGPFKCLMHNLQSRTPARGPFKWLMLWTTE